MSRRKMTGAQFEEHCAAYLKKRGFRKVSLTKASGDQGVDILAKCHGKSYAIQCKLYTKPVGNSAVQQAYAGKQYYECDRGMVMTNSTFTRSATELAERTDILLWPSVPLKKSLGRRILFVIILLAILAGAMYLAQQTAV